MAAFLGVLAVLSVAAPLIVPDVPSFVGGLLLACALTETIHGVRRATLAAQRQAWGSAGVTAGLSVLLLSAPFLAGAALVTFVAGWFALDAVRQGVFVWRTRANPRAAAWALAAMAANLGVIVLLGVFRSGALNWLVAVSGALRIAGAAWSASNAPLFTAQDADETVLDDLGLGDQPVLAARAQQIVDEEAARTGVDAGWLAAFLLTLFAIHVGRMGFDKSAIGVLSPFVAVVGDVVFALLLAFALWIPLRMLTRRVTRRIERLGWDWVLSPSPSAAVFRAPRVLARAWLDHRLRFSIRLRSARYSVPAALSRGLQLGLPLAAIIAATVPVWGMSWYFDTENWAAGVWNSWAESRTDIWREAMVDAVVDAGVTSLDGHGFAVQPSGVSDGDFSFLVIGDTGEGDASQHVLRDSLIRAAGQEHVRFVVISSDVVYPTGAMRDYEPRFWLPFKGVEKPVYAIPGNHDWYDALDGFAATFFTPAAARLAIRARVDADNNVSSTTDARVEELVEQAASLRRLYRVPAGAQQGTFFQVQTPTFALIAVDTGVLKRVDELQSAWLQAALEASRGKTLMLILGHPFYAGGHRLWQGNEDFAALKALVDRYRPEVVMAGDTHDLEYYEEPGRGSDAGARPTHHFVNGGGGAYLSFGTSLAWPGTPPTPVWAFYPSRAAVTAKIEAATPVWKRPAWWWTKGFGAWPFSAEWLSAAFDYNTAPFFQSFVEVRVEPSAGRLRLIPWGIYGPLHRGDFEASRTNAPAAADAPMEWVIETRR